MVAPAMKALARGRRLRGTPVDPFGRTEVRRTEARPTCADIVTSSDQNSQDQQRNVSLHRNLPLSQNDKDLTPGTISESASNTWPQEQVCKSSRSRRHNPRKGLKQKLPRILSHMPPDCSD